VAPIRVTAPPRRSYLFGRRTHHGLCGLLTLLVGAAVVERNPTLGSALVGLGAALAAHDWHDRNAWLVDFLRHPEMN
jgi:hypothetical protein